ncbi:hypothetical protein V8C26DRAFT_421419 [Trichoderma gracile]
MEYAGEPIGTRAATACSTRTAIRKVTASPPFGINDHWIVPVESPGGGTWNGCSLRKEPNGEICVQFSPESLHTNNAQEGSLFKSLSQGAIQDTEVVEFMVVGRCRHLLDGHTHTSSRSAAAKTAESLAKLHAELRGNKMAGERYITAAYIGFDSCMQGPVFARAAKDAADADSPTAMVSSKANSPRDTNDAFDLKGLTFNCDSTSSAVGNGFIPHCAMTSRANMDILRELLTGLPLEDHLYDSEINRYLRHVGNFILDLKTGNALNPFVYVDLNVGPFCPPGKDLRYVLQHDRCCPCDENRPLSHVVCDTTFLSRQDKDGVLSGFRYQAALVEALEYPEELLSMLQDFASLYPNDILPLRTLLLACHLWADITGHRKLFLERFFEKREDQGSVPQVPDIPLAVCLVYYSHWLKWTQWMGLSEFPHPFRFMSQAVKSDMDKEAIGINPDSIDQARVFALIAKAKSRIPLVEASHRIEIMPCYMPGSTMPPMFGPMAIRPEQVPLALTGLPDVQYLGLNSYVRPDNSKDERPARMRSILRTSKYTTVALPTHVRDGLFITLGRLFESSEDFKQVSSRTTKKRCMVPVESEGLRGKRPHKKPRGPNVTQSDASASTVAAIGTSSSSTGPGWVPVCRRYGNTLDTWAEARHGVAHWAHQEGLRQFNELPESLQSGEKLRELIDMAFAQEDTEALHLLKEFGIREASSKPFPLDDEYLSIDLPLAFGNLLGLQPPAKPLLDLWRPQCLDVMREAPDLWTSHFMLQCRQKGVIQEILRIELIRVLSDLWRTTPNDSFTVSSSTEEDSLYEASTSNGESTWDGENASDEESI